MTDILQTCVVHEFYGHNDTKTINEAIDNENIINKIIFSPFISFKPKYHHNRKSEQITVDQEFYRLKVILDTKHQYLTYNGNVQTSERVHKNAIHTQFDITSNPQADGVHYQWEFQPAHLNQLFQNVNHNWKLYDSILRKLFKITELNLKHPFIFRYSVPLINMKDETIKTRIYLFGETPANISEFTGKVSKSENFNHQEGYYLQGDINEIYNVLSKEYIESVQIPEGIQNSPYGFGVY